MTGFPASRCIMIGDVLDIDIFACKSVGHENNKITDSLFNLQSPKVKYEIPTHTVKKVRRNY